MHAHLRPCGPGVVQTDAAKLEGYKRQLVMQLGSLGPGHKETAQTIFCVGQLQLKQRSFREAEESLKNCLKIRKRVVGEYTLDTAHTLCLLGQVYHGIGENLEAKEQISIERYFKLAIKHYRKSLVVVEHLSGGMSPDCLMMLHQMAHLCDRIGEHQQALVCKHRCLQIIEIVDKHSLMEVESMLNKTQGTVGRQGPAGSEVQHKAIKMGELIQTLEKAVKAQAAGGDNDAAAEEKIEEIQEEINQEIEQIQELIEGTGDGTGTVPMETFRSSGSSIFSAGTATLERTVGAAQGLHQLITEKDTEIEAMGVEGHAMVLEIDQGPNVHDDYHFMESSDEDAEDAKPPHLSAASMATAHRAATAGPTLGLSVGLESADNAADAPRGRGSAPGRSGDSATSHDGASECHASGEQSEGGSAGGESLTPTAVASGPARRHTNVDDPFLTHLKAKEPPSTRMPSPKSRQWIIQVNRSSGEEVGIAMTRQGVIRAVKPHGLMFAWNEANPSRAVHEGDLVLEVNGKSGVLLIVEEMQEPRILDITVVRDPHGAVDRQNSSATPEADKADRVCAEPACVVS